MLQVPFAGRLAALLLLLTASAAAQSAPDTTLADVTVTAAREPVATRDAPVRVSILDRAALTATAAASLADALQARAPVHVRRYGPSGLASVTIRGASSSQALVLLDGQRLTDPALGQVDLSLLPAALLKSVEVLSGPASGLYGSDAVGGVIGLRTPSTSRLTTEAGPWGERSTSGVASVHRGVWRATAAGEIGRSTDDYTFRDLSLIGEPRVARQGWDARRATGYAALAVDAGRTAAAASVWAADAERGLGGALVDQEMVGSRQWDRRVRVGATATHGLGAVTLEAQGHVQQTRLRYAAPYPSTRSDAIDDTGRTLSSAADLRASAPAWGGTWTASLSGGTGRAEHRNLPAAATDRFAGLALAGRVPLSPATHVFAPGNRDRRDGDRLDADRQSGGLTLFPALRADLYAPAAGGRRLAIAPQLGLNAALRDDWRLKASAARAFRMPTLNDRYWMPGGNPGLRPESAWSVDAGAVWSQGATQAETTVFATTARDQIVWSPTAAGFFAPRNVSRTRSLGLEASAQTAQPLRLAGRAGLATAGATATLTDARDLDVGQPLRYVPRWSVKAWGGLDVGAVRLDLGARWTGARYTTASASQPLPATLLLDGQLSVRQRTRVADLTVALAAENLTGLQYEVIRSYPMPPRHARLRLTLSPR